MAKGRAKRSVMECREMFGKVLAVISLEGCSCCCTPDEENENLVDTIGIAKQDKDGNLRLLASYSGNTFIDICTAFLLFAQLKKTGVV